MKIHFRACKKKIQLKDLLVSLIIVWIKILQI